MKYIYIILFCFYWNANAQLQINEVCSDNEELLQSEDGNYYDWIEIYNNTDLQIELSDFYLSDDKDDLQKWQFISEKIGAKSYIIVFASDNKERLSNEQHANFKLLGDGETIYLFDGNHIIDTLEFGQINEDYTYGRLEENSEIKTYLAKPTPRESNCNSGTIVSNYESGYYTDEFDLKLTAAKGKKIYYTTNGDTPTETSNLYTDGIEIEDEYEENEYINIPTTPDLDAGCIISWKKIKAPIPRCNIISYRTIDETGSLGKTYSQTFFFKNIHKIPVLSIVTDNQNLFNQDSGIYVPGVNWTNDNPCMSGNYSFRGEEWERAAFFSYFKKSKLITEQYGGMRIHGSGSRVLPQKSLRLYARKNYGINKFPNVFLDKAEIKKFDNFIVRATMSDVSQSLIKDAITMEAVRNLNLEQVYVQPVVVYINGNYWGVQEIRNRFDEDYLADLYSLNEDSISIVGIYGNPLTEKGEKMYEVYNFIVDNDLSIDENYDYVQTVYNIPEIIDYYIAQTFFENRDWPGNNMKFWNSNKDIRFRPLFYDLDASWVYSEFNMIEYCTQLEKNNYPNPSSVNIILVKLLENDSFREQFINRAFYLVDNDFSYDRIKKIIDKYVNEYQYEINRNMDRWNYPESEDIWNILLFKDVYEFARQRGCYYKEHLVNYFHLNPDLLCSPSDVAPHKEVNLKIYPNPATNSILLTGINSKEIGIYNLQGNKLMQLSSFGKNSIEIDISDLTPSIYIIKTDTKTLKLIKIN